MNTEHKEFKSFSGFLFKSEISEARTKRKEIINFIENISNQIRFNLVKLTCFDNPDNISRKICDSLDSWIDEIQDLRFYPFDKNKRLPEDDYFKYIWADKIRDLNDFEELFLEVKAMYKDVLPRKDLKISKVYSQLTRLSKEISKGISRNFFGSIISFFYRNYKIDI